MPAEAFIPFPRQDIIQLCLADGQLAADDAAEFRAFCRLLAAYYHFRFHHSLEKIKANYQVFNPNADVQPLHPPALAEYERMGKAVLSEFQQILEQANYYPLPPSAIEEALDDRSLIALRTQVDFDDFQQVLCYYRGNGTETITEKRFGLWKTERTIPMLERLVLLIHFKGAGYFQAKAQEKSRKSGKQMRPFTPGKMYVYFYKNIPKLDLDLLFPNIQTSMTWKDRLLLVGTAVGAAIPVLLKALPNILLLVAAIMLAVNAREALDTLDVDENQARNIMPVLIATLTLVIALGGFAVKQYSQYQAKKIRFQKDVSDTLFFKNLANNASVFQMLVDIAEEEECKEIMLVYYHLLTSDIPLTPDALDAKIETWLTEKTGATINFDIHGPLQNLQAIRGLASTGEEHPLLQIDDQGYCRVLPLTEAKTVLDYVWDNLFSYNGFV